MSNSLSPHALQHIRFPCPLLSPGVCADSCLLSQWCYLTISSSASPFSCLQSFPASIFSSELALWNSDQNIGASASASVLPMNIQGWSPLGLTALSSLLSKGLSRVFSSTTVWKHQALALSLLYGPFLTSVHFSCTCRAWHWPQGVQNLRDGG